MSRVNSPNSKSTLSTLRADTIIEAMIAITIFSVVAVVTIGLMNSGLSRVQNAMEVTMVRNEIDAQAESLRYIHNSFLSERDYRAGNQEYRKLWDAIKDTASTIPPLNHDNCQTAIDEAKSKDNTFIINSRVLSDFRPKGSNQSSLDTSNRVIRIKKNPEFLSAAPLYPRLVYTQNSSSTENSNDKILENTAEGASEEMPAPFNQLLHAEGIWIQGVAHSRPDATPESNLPPEFYDFHIRACWYPSGGSTPNTIGTILRLYNPEYSDDTTNTQESP